MAFITWNKSYSVDLLFIDKQHMRLVDMINEFYDCLKRGEAKENIQFLLSGLKSYSQYHFAEEEKYMSEFNFSGYEGHKNEHAYFIEKIGDVEERYRNGEATISADILLFLKNWIINHMQGTDRLYIDTFMANGLI